MLKSLYLFSFDLMTSASAMINSLRTDAKEMPVAAKDLNDILGYFY